MFDSQWLDRDSVDRSIAGIDWRTLEYDPDTGLYCLDGIPFTGAYKTRHKDGKLRSLGHKRDGVAHGLSVTWHSNGQVKSYCETEDDVYHGWRIEWADDGTRIVEEHYTEGRRTNGS